MNTSSNTTKGKKQMSTYAELQAQIKKLQEEAEQVKAKELETVIADIKEKISQYELTAEQLGFATVIKGSRSKKASTTKEATVMYKNGELTWSGAARGRKPDWVKEILDAGGDIEKYRVK